MRRDVAFLIATCLLDLGCSSNDPETAARSSGGASASTFPGLGGSSGATAPGASGGALPSTSGAGGATASSTGTPVTGSGGSVTAGGAATAGGSSSCVPNDSCKPTAPNTGDFYADCVARINQFRACMCLPALTRNTSAEACANQQAKYDAEHDSAHAGVTARVCSPASLNNAAQNECPGWGSTQSTISSCTQMMFDEGYCTDFDTCGHYLNITDSGTKSVACGYFTTSSGEVWMVQNFY